jgi:exopolysaccharide biosynthesis polyprenyl glycosylphosphotransferase
MNGKLTIPERPTLEPRWLFPMLDAALIFVIFGLAYFIRYEWQIIRPIFDPRQYGFSPYMPFAAVYAMLLYFSYYQNGLYRNVRGRNWGEEISIIISGVATSTVILLALYFVLRPEVTSRLMLIYVAGLTVIIHSGLRLLRRAILAYLRLRGIGVQRVLIVGMGETGQAVMRVMVSRRELDYKVVGYVRDASDESDFQPGQVRDVMPVTSLQSGLQRLRPDLVVITLPWHDYDRIQSLAQVCRDLNVDVRLVPDIFQLNLRQVQVENLDGIPLLGFNGTQSLKGAERIFKRVLDVGLVILTAPLWLPIFALLALAIRLEGPGPIFYTTKRVGENGNPFLMLKFRSMVPNADAMRDEVIAKSGEDPRRPKPFNDTRITRVGRLIRQMSLDELPNIINVLKGEMSLVGPRPPLPSEVALYAPWQHRRLNTIPGMTGLWQVSGRSNVPFDEMCLMDIYYIENWSIWFDLHILLMTVPRVLLRSGAY